MLKIILKKILVNKNRVDFEYDIPSEYSQFFSEDTKFFYEYPEKYILDDIPESVLVIPFVMNFMPLIWISNGILIIDKLDATFFESLSDILKGYKKVHPNIDFKGKLSVKELEKNSYLPNADKKAMLFSGGADAVSTLVTHISEKPMLINIWGADIQLDDIENHNIIEKDLNFFTKENSLSFFFIKSSLRWCFDEDFLSKYYKPLTHDNWWHGMQHGVGLLSLLAPYDYLEKVSCNYIASSYTPKDVGIARCASYPFIDSKLKMMSTNCFHDGFENRRIDKINNIVSFANKTGDKSIPLKVCFRPQNGENCCKCEKCLRTMSSILAVGGQLKQFGFEPDYKKPEDYIQKFCSRSIIDSDSLLSSWKDIADFVKENGTQNPKMKWIATYEFNKFTPKWYTPIEAQIRIHLGKIRHMIVKKRGK